MNRNRAYGVGCRLLLLFRKSLLDSLKIGLKIKGINTVLVTSGFMDVQLSSIVAADPIKLSDKMAITAKDCRLFLFNFCYNFLYNSVISEEKSKKFVEAKEWVASALGNGIFHVLDDGLVEYMSRRFDRFRSFVGQCRKSIESVSLCSLKILGHRDP